MYFKSMKKPLKTDAELLCEALEKIEKLEEENRWLKRQVFGQKSEKVETPNPEQTVLNLFDEEIEIPGILNSETDSVSTKPTKENTVRRGRKPIPDSIPAKEILITPKEGDLTCDNCGKEKVEIGREENKTLRYIPAHFEVINYVRPKFACSCGEAGVSIADTPSRPIDKSIAEASLLSHIAVSKYVDHLPLYRQSQIFARYNFAIPRSTMGDWIDKMHQLLGPLLVRMKESILASGYIQADETTLKVQQSAMKKSKKKACHLGYLWPFTDGEQVLFEYHPGRGKKFPSTFLKEFKGYLQTDGYEGYREISQKPEVTRLMCWAHARRYFFNAKEHDDRAEIFIQGIAKLYQIEKEAHETCVTFEERQVFREEKARPVLDKIKQLLDDISLSLLPKSLLGKAVNYTRNHWDELIVYLDDGRLLIDNNRIENLIRPVALGRKNWLFAGSDSGAKRSALFYSLLGSCKIRGINPFEYLQDVLERINDTKMSDLDQLLPKNWKPLSSM